MTTPDPRYPLMRYLRIQATVDSQIIDLLKVSRRDVERQLRTIIGNKPGAIVRREQLRLAQAAINRELDRVWRNLRGIVETESLVAAKAAVGANGAFDSTLLRAGLSRAQVDALERSLVEQSKQAVQHAINRKFDTTGTSNITLSEKVYHSRQVIDKQVQRLVNSALARGLSAREFAREAMQFIRPDTAGGVRYAAMRLARTEINNAFHYAQTRDNAQKPWVTGQKWNLSGSHPKADICNEYADGDHANLGAGVYKKDDVPAKPHPHCLCFVTPDTVSPDQWIKQFKAGKYDGFIEERLPAAERPLVELRLRKSGGGADLARVPQHVKDRLGAEYKRNIEAGMDSRAAMDEYSQAIVDAAKGLDKTPIRPSAPIPKAAPKPANLSKAEEARIRREAANRERLGARPADRVPMPRPVEPKPVRPNVEIPKPRPAQEIPKPAPSLPGKVRVDVSGLSDSEAAAVRRAVDNQAKYVPRSLKRFDGINGMDAKASQQFARQYGADALGGFDGSQIRITRQIFSSKYNAEFKKDLRSKWFSRAAPGTSGLDNFIAHETGHFVHQRALLQGVDRLRPFWRSIADEYGLKRPLFFDERSLNKWVELNQDVLARRISKYGATESAELVAEIWAEYTSGAATPEVNRFAKILQELAEENS